MYGTTIDTALIGKKITHVFVNQDFLRFETETGEKLTYTVEGDCCSRSVFYDFIGVRKLLDNGPVLSVKEINLQPTDIEETGEAWCRFKDKSGSDDSIQVYGFEVVTESPEFGEQTSVFSFRNYSNGYYGGNIADSNFAGELPELTEDTIHIE